MAGSWDYRQGGKQAPHLDIATFFLLRTRQLFLNDPAHDCAIWIVKRSALRSGHWKKFRALHRPHLTQTVDLIHLQPFGGGDAKQCCLLAEHTAFEPDLDGKVVPQVSQTRSPEEKRPAPHENWSAVRNRIMLIPAVPAPPQADSDYAPNNFRQGASVKPHILLVCQPRLFAGAPKSPRGYPTLSSQAMEAAASQLSPHVVEVPRSWLSTLLQSKDILPFARSCIPSQAIIPAKDTGALPLDTAMEEPAWEALNHLYTMHRGRSRNTPKSLAKRPDDGMALSIQPL